MTLGVQVSKTFSVQVSSTFIAKVSNTFSVQVSKTFRFPTVSIKDISIKVIIFNDEDNKFIAIFQCMSSF